jgi:hypothetical protein
MGRKTKKARANAVNWQGALAHTPGKPPSLLDVKFESGMHKLVYSNPYLPPLLRYAALCGAMMRWAVLCCAVLRCTVLCCAVLLCAVLCCAVLCCAALCCALLRCAALC